MQNFHDNLKNHFQELYTRKLIGTQMLQQGITPRQRAEVSNGLQIVEMQIEAGLEFLKLSE